MKAECEELKKDCVRLKVQWNDKWNSVYVNVKWCTREKNNPNFTYKIIGSKLTIISQEWYLGVLKNCTLKYQFNNTSGRAEPPPPQKKKTLRTVRRKRTEHKPP